MSDQTKGTKKATRAAIICFFVEFTRTLLHRMNSWQFIMHHNKTNENHNHENTQQQNNKNEFFFHLFTTPHTFRSHRLSRMGRLRSRACARPVIFDFCLHLFTKPTYYILFHRVTGEGFTPFFLHPPRAAKIERRCFLHLRFRFRFFGEGIAFTPKPLIDKPLQHFIRR